MKSPQVTKPRFALKKRFCSGCTKLDSACRMKE